MGSGEMSIGPGLSGELTVARWTAPLAGYYDITARFLEQPRGGDSADAYVYRNSTQLLPAIQEPWSAPV